MAERRAIGRHVFASRYRHMSLGALRRVVRLSAGAGEARGILHDDFHHFRVAIQHDGSLVTDIHAETRRGPFSLCPNAGAALQALVGLSITPRAAEIFAQVDARLQCTHQFDLAAFVIASAARGSDRIYQVTVSDPIDGCSAALAERDGCPVLQWGVRNYAIATPAKYAGISLGRGFTEWIVTHCNPEEAEAAFVLRRGVFVLRGRSMREELDRRPHAPITSACWVQQPERARDAIRPSGVIRDYAETGVPFDADDQAWLHTRV